MIERFFPLHPAQQDIYVDQVMHHSSPDYNLGFYLILTGNLDKTLFSSALDDALSTHDVFRLRFDLDRPEAVAIIADDHPRDILIEKDFTAVIDPEKLARTWLQERLDSPMLLQPALLPHEHYLLKINENISWYFCRFHHLVMDGVGLSNWLNDLGEHFRERKAGGKRMVKAPSYLELMKTTADYYQSAAYVATKHYWQQKIPATFPVLLEKKHQSIAQKYSSGIHTLELSPAQDAIMKDLINGKGAGIQKLSLAALIIYFARITGQQQPAFGISLHKRGSREERKCVGMFSGLLPFCGSYDPEETLSALLSRISNELREDYPHYRYLPSDLKALLHNSGEDTPLFDVIVNYGRLNFTPDFGEDTQAEFSLVRNNHQRRPLEIFWQEFGEGHPARIEFIYHHSYFTSEEIAWFARRFISIIGQFPDALNRPVSSIQVISTEEAQLIKSFSNEEEQYTADDTIVSVFKEQVALRPEAIALQSEKLALTFAELDQQSEDLAAYLLDKGVQPGMPVPVGMDRSPALIISILALLKAGAAYVPIDTEYPLERIKLLIADLKSPIAITTSDYADLFDVPELILTDRLEQSGFRMPKLSLSDKSAAYLMYTSGSTGIPKGVIVSHRNVVSLVKAHNYFPFSPADRLLAAGSPAFDAATFEYWSTLLNGGQLVLASKAALMDSRQLKEIILRYGVNKMFFTTGWFNLLVDTDISVFEGLSAVIVGGERFPVAAAEKLKAHYPDLQLYNGYGPTENTTFSLSYQIQTGLSEIPVGKPLSYRSAYILDENLETVPIGVSGELYVGGAGLADGYFRQPELTSKTFIRNPFAGDKGADRLYRTGDLARWLPDGNIAFVGRKDDQVKIRGFRVEPAETAATIQRSELVKQVVVTTRADATGILQLLAYVVAEPGFDKETLLTWLETQLPSAMVPSYVMVLDQIPLTANGKTDKAALPAPEQTKTSEMVLPRNETEQQLAEVWMELLQRPQISIHDDFFRMGGHSLMAMRVIAYIRNEWDIKLSPTVFFSCKTIAKLAAHIDELQEEEQVQEEFIQPQLAVGTALPVSFGQERMWFVDRLQGSVQYHIVLAFRIHGGFNLNALVKSFNHILNRHEALRTVIRAEHGLPYAHVLEKDSWKADVISDHPDAADREKVQELVEELLSRPFNLSEEHPLRAHLIRISEAEHLLAINVHHIAADGWSLSILSNELITGYHAFAADTTPELPSLPLQYADYARRQRNEEGALTAQLDYWQKKLSGTPSLNLPLDFKRPAVQSTRGASMVFKVNKTLTEQLKQLSLQEDVTLYMTLLAAFKVLLQRYSSQDDVCVGAAVSGRMEQQLEGLIGFFVNTLALRTDLSGDPDFRSVLQRVKATTLEAYDHQEAPFEKVVNLVMTERDTSRSPLFQVVFVLQNTPDMPEMKLGDALMETASHRYQTSQFDLHFSLSETEEGLSAEVSYCTDLFKAATVSRLLDHFSQLLRAIVENPDVKVANITLISEAELELIKSFSNEKEEYTGQDTIVSLFKAQVAIRPEAIAVQSETTALTFAALDLESERLAAYLQKKGVQSGMPVPVCIDRSPALIISILALLKAGAAYVPVDPEYPQERINLLIADLNSPFAVVTSNYAALFDVRELILTDQLSLPDTRVMVGFGADHPAYIMYTSGSTGKPKGVLVSHRNVVSLVQAKDYFPLSPDDRILAAGSPAFDATTFEYWSTLLNGAQLILADKAQLMDSTQLKKIIRKHGVNKMFFTTGWFNLLADTDISVFETLSAVIVGGERFSAQRAETVITRYPHLQLHNGYGPTENTTFSLSYLIKSTFVSEVPVGRPLNYRSAYILDKNQKIVPIGVTGELYVGGAGLADGYFQQPQLTAKAFILHPFLKDSKERLYRTGDLARWLPDGNIAFEGRADDQVKIRGFRVEPGETEAAILRSSLIKQVVVLTRADATGILQLLAYVVPEPDFEVETLLIWLETQLPAYMIPSHILVLDQIPLTENGKIDKQALPAPENTGDAAVEMPRNQTEQRLAAIWMELLQKPLIGIHDDFFRLGGHSLMVMRVSAFIRNEWGLEVAPTVLFSCKTIARLASHISELQGGAEESLLEVIRPDALAEGHLPVSFGQERLWFIDRLHGSIQYHIILTFKIDGLFDLNALVSSFNHIVNRHEVLRTVIRQEDGLPYQHILEKDTWNPEVLNDHPAAAEEEGLLQLVDELVTRPFVLSEEHMLRTHIIRISEREHFLVVNIHHIAADGWSMSILAKELYEGYHAYAAASIPEFAGLPIQYGDYARWQRRREAILAPKLDYWQRKLSGTALLNLPTDFGRSAMQSVRGETMKLKISTTLTEQLKQFSIQEDVTLYMTLLAAFKILLQRYCSQDDICVGGAISGRMQQEMEGLIGFFVNTLALRTDLSGDPDFLEVLQRVKTTTLEAYDHQEAPFEKVVKLVMGERDTSRNPLFQVVFVLQNAPEMPAMKLGEALMERKSSHYRTSQFDLHFSVFETPEGLYADVAYCSDLFRESTIRRLTGHFEQLLKAIVVNPQLKVADIPMMGTEESHQLLHDFSGIEAEYPMEETIVSLFQKQVARTPERIALTFEKQELSYRELDRRSDALARRLRKEGVAGGSLVPVCTGHAMEMMIGILGVLKAGGVYVPVDPEYPQDRIRFMLEDTAAPLILVLEHTVSVIAALSTARLICLSDDWEEPGNGVLLPACKPEQAAYIIYTSGSTGRPKGVIIPHRNVVRLFMTSVPLYDFNEQDVWTMFHSYCFDFSVWEMYGALFYGGRMVIVPRSMARDTIAFAALLRTEGVTVLNQTPSAFYVLQESLQGSPTPLSLRYVIFGGEALHPSRLKAWNVWYPECRLINMYGITETTVHVTFQEIGEEEMNSGGSKIGKPIPTLSAYILDPRLQPVPIGVPGELFIAGAGVASGYLNREELTRERFIPHPFSDDPEEKIYRTGDLGRWMEDGSIEYLGRIDTQVKIRGYRIEPGEIEHALNRLPQVAENCVVLKASAAHDKKLVCYYVPDQDRLKELEQSLYEDQVNNWKVLYEDTYGNSEPDTGEEEFNIAGWNDSFTGGAIPAADMQAWLDDIAQVILSQKPKHVLEIGCGTGMIYYQLAPHIRSYAGVDLSEVSVAQIRRHVNQHPEQFPDTHLRSCGAHEVKPDEMEKTDTVIMNSVIQYFPGEDYLTRIIADNIVRLEGSGRIILGDVRDYRLLYAFKSRLSLAKLQERAAVMEFSWLVDQEMMKEEELCFTPDYFYQLPEQFPEISHVEIRWKEGDYVNELSLYRFTVILHIGLEKAVSERPWSEWDSLKTSPDQLFENHPPVIAISGIPNPRLWKERQLLQGLRDHTAVNVRDLIRAVEQPDEENEKVTQLLKTAKEKGYQVNMMPAKDPMQMELLLELNPTGDFVMPLYQADRDFPFTNIPLFPDITAILQKEIRQELSVVIPDYMVPTDLIALQRIPVTGNGKADRAFLSRLEDQQRKHHAEYQAPSTEREELLANIWMEILGVDRVGVKDNFFELGGDSIRVVKVAARIRKLTGMEVSVADIYRSGTILELAELLASHAGNEGSVTAALQQDLKEIEAEFMPMLSGRTILEAVYPMSDIQCGMIYASLRDPESAVYHDQFLYPVARSLDLSLFEEALRMIVTKHEILRTTFHPNLHEQGLQAVHKNIPVKVRFLDRLSSTAEVLKPDLREYLKEEREKPFDLEHGPLWRATLVNWQEGTVFVLQFHHAILDGWSVAALNTELFNLYLQLEKSPVSQPLTRLKGSYRDFVLQNRMGRKTALNHDFWKKEMEDHQRLDLFTAEEKQDDLIASYTKEMLDSLKNLAKEHRLSLKGIFLGATLYTIGMLSHQRRLTIGLVTNNRPVVEDGDQLLGCFLNTIPFVFEMPDGKESWAAYFRRIEDKLQLLKSYDLTSLSEIARINTASAPQENPFFDVIFNFINFHIYDELEEELMDVSLAQQWLASVSYGLSNTFLDCSVSLTGDTMAVVFSQGRKLQSGKTLKDVQHYFDHVLDCFRHRLTDRISKQSFLPAREQLLLLHEWNDTLSAFPRESTLISCFEESALRYPDRIALITATKSYTYKELQEWSARLATKLIHAGVKPGMFVLLLADRSADTVAGILAIMKAAAAYVPLDPNIPATRLMGILEDTKAKFVLGCRNVGFPLPSDELNWIGTEVAEDREVCLFPVLSSASDAYVIYTSGSTGRPKGVPVKHRAVLNLIWHYAPEIGFTMGERVLQFYSFSFDASVQLVFLPLIHGAALLIPEQEALQDPDLFRTMLEAQNISHLDLTPGFLQSLGREALPGSLKRIVVGGEECPPELAAYWGSQLDFMNEYGPTETTIVATRYRYHEEANGKRLSIGKPIPNTRIYILDEGLQLLPAGVAGEICISGEGVSSGYLNRPEQNATQFIPDVFNEDQEARMYRTGDLGRWLPDGTLEYLGRADDQVKIRGYRIEPAEVEAILLQHEGVQQAAVVVHIDDVGDKRLLAYLVPAPNTSLAVIEASLRERLPAYMMPAHIFLVEELPVTISGKVDRRLLAASGLPLADAPESVEPSNERESLLLEIWQQLLGLKRISIDDDFFLLGGHSLNTLRLLGKIRQAGYEVQLQEVLSHSTIARQATLLADRKMDEALLSLRKSLSQHVLLLNDSAEERNVFLLPGSTGNCDSYDELANALSDKVKVYGIQMMGLLEGEKPLQRMEEIAALQLSWIREIQPKGPYRLIGHSFGGQVLYEMTRQLEELGEEVDVAIMLDVASQLRGAQDLETFEVSDVMDFVLLSLEKYDMLGLMKPSFSDELLPELQNLAAQKAIPCITDLLKHQVALQREDAALVFRVMDLNLTNMLLPYRISGKVKAPLTIVKASVNPLENAHEALGWQDHASSVMVMNTSGDHFSMLRDAFALELGDALKVVFASTEETLI